MDSFPWWTEKQKELAEKIEQFADEIRQRIDEAWWKQEIPWDVINMAAERGYFGAGVPEEYGGMGLGTTGVCIISEVIMPMPVLGRIFGSAALGGLHQIIKYGDKEQKDRFLPRIAQGEIGGVSITEPVAGTDVAAIETTARREGQDYIITGKKRFTTGVGVAKRYMLYAKTSDDTEARRRRRHMTGFLVEKGMPGFTVEKVNELIGWDNVPNGYLNLDEVRVPLENRIGDEGDGWKVLMAGFNFERAMGAACEAGNIWEMLKAVVPYTQRRIQFGRPTIEIPANRFKIADLITKLKVARLNTYYAAYLLDIGQEGGLDASVAKLFNSEMTMDASVEAIQIMGGDGVTKFYPLEFILRTSKISQIAGGTDEAQKIAVCGLGLKELAPGLKMRRRVRHKELGVPIHTGTKPSGRSKIDEVSLLRVLSEDYRINPGLHMSREDLKEEFDVSDEEMDEALRSLEKKGLVWLHMGKNGIELAKASYEGLKKANPPEYYKWFPRWINREDMF